MDTARECADPKYSDISARMNFYPNLGKRDNLMSEQKRDIRLRPLSELISLEGKRAIITGAASGIGRAIAYRFAEAGASLVLVDVNMEGLQSLERDMKENTVSELHRVDLSDKKAIDLFWEKLEGGSPEILMNNAGIYPFKDFLEVDEEFLKRIIDTNLNSIFWMSQQMDFLQINWIKSGMFWIS